MTDDITDVTNYTAYDIVLSTIYLPILIQVAKDKKNHHLWQLGSGC